MIMKGLLQSSKTFCTIITQKDREVTFSDFKVSLSSYEESELGNKNKVDRILKVVSTNDKITCFLVKRLVTRNTIVIRLKKVWK